MRLIRLLIALVGLSVFVGQGQLGLHAQALPTATGPGSFISAGVGIAQYRIEYGERWLGGWQGWVDLNPWWWGGVEIETKTLIYNQDLNTHASTLLAGPRVSLSSRTVEPYIKCLAGRGTFDYPYSYARGTYLVASGGAGVDFHFGSHLQWRALEGEYQVWPNFSFGNMRSFGVTTGLSYTFLGAKSRQVRR